MKIERRSVVFGGLIYLSVSACKQEDVQHDITCIGPDQKQLILHAMTDGIDNSSKELVDMDSLKVDIYSIRTIDADKKHAHCEATIKGSILPTDLGRKYLYSRFTLPETLKISNIAATISSPREVSYTIIITDDHKSIFLEDGRNFKTRADSD